MIEQELDYIPDLHPPEDFGRHTRLMAAWISKRCVRTRSRYLRGVVADDSQAMQIANQKLKALVAHINGDTRKGNVQMYGGPKHAASTRGEAVDIACGIIRDLVIHGIVGECATNKWWATEKTLISHTLGCLMFR